MAKREVTNLIINLFSKLGGNMNNVLGSRSNITFLGKGKNPEGFIDSDINIEAIGVLGKNKILEELESSMGYLTAGKLNDVQANKLLSNMTKIDDVFNPKQVPNITDMATGTKNLDAKGLASLRGVDEVVDESPAFPFYLNPEDSSKAIRSKVDDLPPPGSRGGPDDIAAPIQDAETTIRNLEKQDPAIAAQFRSVVTNQGDAPGKRGVAREFLVEALKEDDLAKGGNTFSDFVSAEDIKYITEGGGGIAGDPVVLVNKYFGPRIAEMLPTNASSEEIAIFTKRVLNNVVDAAGNRPDSPRFDRLTATFIDEVQDFAKGGLAKILEV